MANGRGMIEIRLDKRQAFYAFVGCMLIVSVAFVVGIIVGQRMDIPDPSEALALHEEGAPTESAPPVMEVETPEPDDFTFYDELSVNAPPSHLVFEAAQDENPAFEPTVRALEREVDTTTEHARPIERIAAAQPPPAPEPEQFEVPEPIAPEPAVQPRSEPEPVVNRGQDPDDSDTRTVQRRAVRQSTADEGPEEFGYFIVEVGRFASFDEADARRIELQQDGHNAIVTLLGDSSQLRFRVQVGNYTRRSEAVEVADQVHGRVVQEG